MVPPSSGDSDKFNRLFDSAQTLLQQGSIQKAMKASETLLRLAEQHGETMEKGAALLLRGTCLFLLGQLDGEITSILDESAVLSEQVDSWDMFGQAKFLLGMVATRQGYLVEAITHWAEGAEKLKGISEAMSL